MVSYVDMKMLTFSFVVFYFVSDLIHLLLFIHGFVTLSSLQIVENIARKYGVSKSELLDREASDLAVRVAAGETEIISETKKALASAGVNIASLEDFASGKTNGMIRSNYVLLVKNLPYNTNEAELMEMFGRYGSLDKVILPPTRTMALVSNLGVLAFFIFTQTPY